MPSPRRLTATPGRLDKALGALAPELSRARLQALIKAGEVCVNGKPVTRASHVLKGGEELELSIPEAKPAKPAARAIPLDVVFEDKHLLVINKPVGLVVHPAAGHEDDTLVNALLAHCGESLSGIGGEARPGIVHRLDKDTSGLLVVAKNDAAHQGLSEQFSGHHLARVYIAFSWGLPKQAKGTIDAAIGRATGNRKKMALIHAMNVKSHTGNFYGYREERDRDKPHTPRGKHAITHYAVLEAFGTLASKMECRLETGRTHQIRVHLSSIGHSLIGDPLYGRATGLRNHAALKKLKPEQRDFILDFPRQALHAAELSFTHPATGKEMHFKADWPEDLKKLERALKKLA